MPGGGGRQRGVAQTRVAGREVPELVSWWRGVSLDQPPFVHPEDKSVLEATPGAVSRFKKFTDYAADELMGDRNDGTFHLGLLPTPYMGDLQRATIFVLTLNPGLHPSDYFVHKQHSSRGISPL